MASNPHGLDYKYFECKIAAMYRDGLSSWRPDELARELMRMSRTADAAVMLEPEFSSPADHLRDATKMVEQPAPVSADSAEENMRFEKWAKTQSNINDLRTDEIGLYYNQKTGIAHDAWQARANIAAVTRLNTK